MKEHVADDAVHLWIAPRQAWEAEPAASFEALLSPDEAARSRDFAFDDVRQEFVRGRALVRTALSACAGVAPGRWRFALGAHGKPEVAQPTAWRHLQFNLSHSHGLIACAVTRRQRIGIDVESHRRAVDCEELARTTFSPSEVESMMALPAPARRRRFFDCWVLKESYIKARGLGLQLPLDQFSVVLTDPSMPRMSMSSALHDDPAQWRFGLMTAGADHVLALAVQQRDRRPLPVIKHAVHRMAADIVTHRGERLSLSAH